MGIKFDGGREFTGGDGGGRGGGGVQVGGGWANFWLVGCTPPIPLVGKTLKFGLLYKVWDYLIGFSCQFAYKGHLYPKNKFQKVMGKTACSSYRNAWII